MGGPSADRALPEPEQSRRQFERAADSFATAAFVHDETRQRLLERLELFRIDVTTAVDLGAALGAGADLLAERFPAARVIGVDSSAAMLAESGSRAARFDRLRADAERLPLVDGIVDLLLANLLLPWCRPENLLAEAARVLAEDGLFLFATLGPDSFAEVRSAWAQVDDRVHVHGFLDMHDVGDLVVRAGLREPVMDVDRIEVSYGDVDALVRDLRACGGCNVAAGRRKSMTAPGRWRRFERALADQATGGRFNLTLELIFGHAWGRAPEQGPAPKDGEIAVPIDALGRRR